MSRIINEPTVDEEKINLARSCIEHRATWMALTYAEMEKRGVDAEGVTRAAIRKCGTDQGSRIRAACANPADLRDFYAAFLTEDTKKFFEMDIKTAAPEALGIEFHYCALVNAWKKLGLGDDRIDLLCDIAMEGDRGIAESMGITLDLTDTIAKGCATCKLRFHR